MLRKTQAIDYENRENLNSPLLEKKKSCKFFLSYKLEFSDTFYTIIINVFKGEHELETILINYSLDEKMIDYKIIAYDEIAESQSRKFSKIDKMGCIAHWHFESKQLINILPLSYPFRSLHIIGTC